MLYKTDGLVINTINYSDKYVLVQIFTKEFGRVTYMVSKTRSKSSKVQRALFYPLALLHLEVEHKPSRDIQHIKEVQILHHQYDTMSNIGKTSVVFFLSEFLARVLKETERNDHLYSFLDQSVRLLEMTENSIANFHLVFMLKLSHFLGFYPNLEDYVPNSIFDMRNGEFVINQPLHNNYVNKNESADLARLSRISFENMHKFIFKRQDRINIINRVLEYYRLHLNDFPKLKSLDVLHELF